MSPNSDQPTVVAERRHTPETSRRSDARRNRQAILDAATELFTARGWDVSVHDIAAAAGVGVGTLYRHFPNKEVLAGALLAQRFDVTALAIRELVTETGLPFDRLSQALWTSAEHIAAHPVAHLAMTRGGPPTAQHAAPARQRFREGFVPLIDAAHRDGSLREDFASDDVWSLMAAVCATVDDSDPTRWRHILEIAVDGLRGRH